MRRDMIMKMMILVLVAMLVFVLGAFMAGCRTVQVYVGTGAAANAAQAAEVYSADGAVASGTVAAIINIDANQGKTTPINAASDNQLQAAGEGLEGEQTVAEDPENAASTGASQAVSGDGDIDGGKE